MILRSVEIKDYRSIEHVVLEVSEGVTVLTGPSDVGKSNVLRAIRDAMYGTRGHAHVRHGAKTAEVTLTFDDHVFKWSKGKGGASYFVDGKAVQEDQYQRVLRVKETELDKGVTRRLNFASQHDGPFLLNDSPSVAAKALSSMSGLHVLTLAHTQAKRDLQQTTRVKTQAEAAIKAASATLEETKDRVDQQLKHISRAEKLLKARDLSCEKLTHLQSIEVELTDACAVMRELKAQVHVPDLTRDLDKLRRAEKRLDALTALLDRAHSTASDLHRQVETRRRITLKLDGASQALQRVKSCPTCGRAFGAQMPKVDFACSGEAWSTQKPKANMRCDACGSPEWYLEPKRGYDENNAPVLTPPKNERWVWVCHHCAHVVPCPDREAKREQHRMPAFQRQKRLTDSSWFNRRTSNLSFKQQKIDNNAKPLSGR